MIDFSCLETCTKTNVVIDGTKINNSSLLIRGVNELVAAANSSIKGGQSVILLADMNLAGVNFPGLNAFNSENNNTFDGMGYTVSNFSDESGKADFGFIRGWVGSIKNINFDNCHIKGGGRIAIVAGNVYSNIENVHVTNSSIESSYWACGIVAGLYNSGNVTNCTVTNSSVKCNGGTGAIVGVLNESAGVREFTNCHVTGCTINNTGVYGEAYSASTVVGMINIENSTVKFSNCSQSGNTFEGAYYHDALHAPASEDVTVVIE